MTEHELEQRVRAWYRDEIGRDEPAPTSLRSALLQIASVPENPLSIRRNLVLLAAAAMLALALGSAIAIGSGLVRPPWSGNRPLVPIAGRCEPTLSDGVVMTLAGVPAGGLEPEQWMVLYDDGRLVQGPHARADMAEMGGIWTVRQVSPEGLTLVQDLLERVDLPSCQSYAITGRDGHQDLMARTAGGVSAFGLGMEAFETRMTSHSEEATASVLADRLNNLDAWIPSSGWTDSTATPYLPDRWSVTVWFPDNQVVGPFAEAWDARLPGGSTLRTFGTELPATEGLLIARCGVVGADDALTIWTALHDESSVVPGELDPFQLQVTLVDGGTVNFRALLLGEAGCISPKPDDDESVSASVDVSACDYLPEAVASGPHDEGFDGDWWTCEYYGGTAPLGGGWVWARGHRTSSEDGPRLATLQFGDDGFTTEQIGGQTVFLNDCALAATAPGPDEAAQAPNPCMAAIAVSEDPYFVVIAWDDGSGTTLRLLAEAVIEGLAE